MSKNLDIAAVAKRTGLSSRALRYYEARGLIKPLRTHSGRRIYAANDLERIHQIVALKSAGMNLADIDRLLSGRAIGLKALLEAQLSALEAREQQIAEARELIKVTLSRMASDEPIDVIEFCSLIQEGKNISLEMNWDNIVDQFWPDEAKEQFRQKREELRMAFSADAWVDLGKKIKAALPLDPASDQALGFVKDWYALLEPLEALATKEMVDASSQMHERMAEWPGDSSPGFDMDVWSFINEAAIAAHASGHIQREAQAWQHVG